MKLTFRIDDVSSNTDMPSLKRMIRFLKGEFICDVWLCVNIFSMRALDGSVYPNPPFKSRERAFFYGVNQYKDTTKMSLGQDAIVSHGLFHADHSALSRDAQEMSILGSCNILNASIFVPPFNRFNEDTRSVCSEHGIRLIESANEGWRSLEHEPFTLAHERWYFHPWRFSEEEFKGVIQGGGSGVSAKSI